MRFNIFTIPNFLSAIIRVFRNLILRRPVLVPEDIAEYRKRICVKQCTWYDPDTGQCMVCTCFVDLKVALATERCPKGRWSFYYKGKKVHNTT